MLKQEALSDNETDDDDLDNIWGASFKGKAESSSDQDNGTNKLPTATKGEHPQVQKGERPKPIRRTIGKPEPSTNPIHPSRNGSKSVAKELDLTEQVLLSVRQFQGRLADSSEIAKISVKSFQTCAQRFLQC